MAVIRPIRSEQDYEAALARLSDLMDILTALPSQTAYMNHPDKDEYEVLGDLIEAYENRHYPIDDPSPLEAIEFRMEQQGLTPRDLIPILGSRETVSQLLSGERELTMPMARALHEHLGIPAEVLLQRPAMSSGSAFDKSELKRFPVKEMVKRGLIPSADAWESQAEKWLACLVDRVGSVAVNARSVFYRKNDHQRINARTDPYALLVWCWHVLATVEETPPVAPYRLGAVTHDYLRQVAQLSHHADGPLRAHRLLAENGIVLAVVSHLPRTHLDGAALRTATERPVIGLTLRYDRIDNFWFSLLHELAHVGWHLDEEYGFIDDMRLPSLDAKEIQADDLAREALIPQAVWDASHVRTQPNIMNAIHLAHELNIHPAIVAGRVRYERNNYRLLSQLVGNGQVRRHFDDAGKAYPALC